MDFVGKRGWFFLASLITVVASVVSLILPGGLNAGLEFSGGSSITVAFEEDVSQSGLRSAMEELGHPDAMVQRLGEGNFFIRTRTLEEAEGDGLSERETIISGLESALDSQVTRSELFSVSPSIAAETVRNAIVILFIASVAILLYITWAFRKVPSPLRYGISAIIALLHDVVVVVGIFSIVGRYLDLEVNAMFIAGVLTIIGYSVHDTIVVFDRLRENLIRGFGHDLGSTINISIEDTLGRSLNTSVTLLFTIIALLLFGGPTIFEFLLILFIGIIVGTYSSIWIASQVLLVWENKEFGSMARKLLPFGTR